MARVGTPLCVPANHGVVDLQRVGQLTAVDGHAFELAVLQALEEPRRQRVVVGAEALAVVVDARQRVGPFADLEQFKDAHVPAGGRVDVVAQFLQLERADGHAHKVAHADAVVEAPDLLGDHKGVDLARSQVHAIDRLQHAQRLEAFIEGAEGLERRIVDGLHVIGAGGRDGVAETDADLAARLVHGQFLALDMVGDRLRCPGPASRRQS